MASKHFDLEALAEDLLNSPKSHDKLKTIKAWNNAFNTQTGMGGLSPRVFWDRLKGLGLLNNLLDWALLDQNLRWRGIITLQAASMIAFSRFSEVPGIFEFITEDEELGALFRARGAKCYSTSFGELVDHVLTNPSDLSYHHVASISFLEPMFRWAKSKNPALIRAVDRDYVLWLVYYVSFDPTAFQPSDHADTPPKQEVMVRVGGVLSGLRTANENLRSKNKAAEDLINWYGVSQVIKWCGAFFVDELHTYVGVVDAATKIVSSLQEVERFQIPYAQSDIPKHMITAMWKCARDEEALGQEIATFFPIYIMHQFAICQECTLNYRSPRFYRPRLTADHARDVLLLLGKALMVMTRNPSQGQLADTVDVIERYIMERHVDDNLDPQFTSTMINCLDLVLSSLRLAIRSEALQVETENWAIRRWKELMSKLLNIQIDAYVAWKFAINPHTQQPYDMCCWYRCPMYRMKAGTVWRQPLVCSKCRMTSYCSIECQRSDWKEGRHQKTCERPPARL